MATPAPTTLHLTLIIYYLYCIPIKENSHFSANTATQQHEKVPYFLVELSPAEVKKHTWKHVCFLQFWIHVFLVKSYAGDHHYRLFTLILLYSLTQWIRTLGNASLAIRCAIHAQELKKKLSLKVLRKLFSTQMSLTVPWHNLSNEPSNPVSPARQLIISLQHFASGREIRLKLNARQRKILHKIKTSFWGEVKFWWINAWAIQYSTWSTF